MVSEFSEKQKIFIASQGILRFKSLTPEDHIHRVPPCVYSSKRMADELGFVCN